MNDLRRWADIESRLDALQTEVGSAASLDDWRDVGNRARLIIIDAVNYVFSDKMVPDGSETPKGDDAKRRLDYYFRARIPESPHEDLRNIMRKALGLAHAVTHSKTITRIDAFAATQATLLTVRCLQEIEDDAIASDEQNRGMKVTILEARRIGDENHPGVEVIAVVENLERDLAFVRAFEVEMKEPFHRPAVKYEYRSDPRTKIDHLAMNVPGRGISVPVIIMAFFDEHLPTMSDCVGRVAVIGLQGSSARWVEFKCAPLIVNNPGA